MQLDDMTSLAIQETNRNCLRYQSVLEGILILYLHLHREGKKTHRLHLAILRDVVAIKFEQQGGF